MSETQKKPTLAERQAQSKRDKAQNAQNVGKGKNQGGSKQPLGGGKGKGQSSVAAAYSTKQRSSAPKITASRDEARIVHRELLASVVGSAAFAVPLSLALNPGLAASFPWLSTQAQAWETYTFNKLRFCAYTRTGSTTPGSLMLVPDYDAQDTAPISEQIASSYEDVSEDVPWKDIMVDLRKSSMFPMGPKKFVRSGPVPSGGDPKTFDAGTLFVCTTDGTAVNWSKLWVEYDVTLHTPQLNPGGNAFSSFHLTGTTPTTASNYANPVIVAGSAPIVTVAGNVITFLAGGKYMVNINQAAGVSDTFATPTVSAGSSFITSYGLLGTGWTTVGAINSVSMLVNMLPGGTLTENCTIVTGTSSELFISPVPAVQA